MNPPSQLGCVAFSADSVGLPRQVGIGFKAVHFEGLVGDGTPPAFVEIHAENYMGAGGAPHRQLAQIRERLPLSLHGVGLSIGGQEALDEAHLARLRRLIHRYQPGSFSEHLAWSSHGGAYLNDLLPVPYDQSTLVRVCEHIDHAQQFLGLRMLLENPATYVEFEASTLAETQFISEVLQRTGCGLLLDVNNVHVTCSNHRRDPYAYIDQLPSSAVGEIHLAGHATDTDGNGGIVLIDDHGSPVAGPVWDLYAYALKRTGPVPTLIEWDNELPDYIALRAEALKARQLMNRVAQAHLLESA